MALPVPVIVSDQSVGANRTKFMANGMGFDRFVATWPVALPPDPPDIDDSGTDADPWRQGDNAAVTHILYRVIENRARPVASAVLPDGIRDLILADPVQYETGWHRHPATDFWYQDTVLPVTEQGRHEEMTPTADTRWAVNATVNCYWVAAWLGVDAENILVGYTPP